MSSYQPEKASRRHPLNLEGLLNSGETLMPPSPLTLSDPRREFCYDIYQIRDPESYASESVLRVIESGGAVEPALVTCGTKIVIRPLAGRGKLFIWCPGQDRVEVHRLDSDDPNEVIVSNGGLCGYKNTGTEPFVVRDDAIPISWLDDVPLIQNPEGPVPRAFFDEYGTN